MNWSDGLKHLTVPLYVNVLPFGVLVLAGIWFCL